MGERGIDRGQAALDGCDPAVAGPGGYPVAAFGTQGGLIAEPDVTGAFSSDASGTASCAPGSGFPARCVFASAGSLRDQSPCTARQRGVSSSRWRSAPQLPHLPGGATSTNTLKDAPPAACHARIASR